MMNDVKNGTINVIVAFKMDRLTRSVYDVVKKQDVIQIVQQMNQTLLHQMVEWL